MSGPAKYFSVASMFSGRFFSVSALKTFGAFLLFLSFMALSSGQVVNLFDAVKNCSPEELNALLKKGLSVSERDANKRTALMIAAELNTNAEVSRILLAKGLNTNDKDVFGNTVLFYAAANINPEVLKLVLATGVDPNQKNRNDYTPIMAAAAFTPNPENIRLLMEANANIRAIDKFKQGVLCHFALSNANIHVLRTLLKNGADKNEKNSNGDTPLTLAARFNTNVEVLNLLVNEGLDVHMKMPDGQNLLMLAAASNKNPDILKFLITAGIDIDEKTPIGMTALNAAILLNPKNPQILKFLIQNKIKINYQDKSGVSPLMLAIRYLNFDAAEMLLDAGANPELESNKGKKAIDILNDINNIDPAVKQRLKDKLKK